MATLDDLTGGNLPSDDNTRRLDDITDMFSVKTQRQAYYEPELEETSDIDASLIDPEGEAVASDFSGVWDPEEDVKEVSPERAHRTGDRIARVIDTGFNFLASNFIAKDSGKEYKADAKDLADTLYIERLNGTVVFQIQGMVGMSFYRAFSYCIPFCTEFVTDFNHILYTRNEIWSFLDNCSPCSPYRGSIALTIG